MPLHLKQSGFAYHGRRARGKGIREIWGTIRDLPSRVRHAFNGPRSGAPPDVRAFLAQHGSEPILGYSICRVPIASGVRTALDVLTFGGFTRAMHRLNYDSVFHLFTTLTLPSGRVQFEKNEVVRVLPGAPKTGECQQVTVSHPVTLASLFANGEKMNSAFWAYSSTNNCQRFTMDLLRGSKLDSPTNSAFVLQDAESLLSPLARKIADSVTDVAARADILRQGLGGRYSSTQKTVFRNGAPLRGLLRSNPPLRTW